ncbi:MAG: hypothetical protein ACFFCS_19190 [Candidatus Hodarchaeota archaeon]
MDNGVKEDIDLRTLNHVKPIKIKKKIAASMLLAVITFQILLVSSINLTNLGIQPGIVNPVNEVGSQDPRSSDTSIVKNWEAEETITSWWDSTWLNRRKITITEPGLMDRDRDPVNVYLTFTGDEARNNSIRIAYYNGTGWNNVSSQVWNATMHSNGSANFYDSCTVMFFVNITKSDTDVYYVYYDPYYNTPANYVDHITVRGALNPDIVNDPGNMPNVYHSNGTTWSGVDSFEIIVDGDTASPQAVVCLVDTMRGQSDWGGSSCSLIRAENNEVDALDINALQWMSIGEIAVDADGYDSYMSVGGGFSGEHRVNIGPDNPAEAWDGNGNVTVEEDGPLFTRVRITTTDGAFQYVNNSEWWRDDMSALITSDSVSRGNGGAGYATYDIVYTFYYYGGKTFAKIDLDFTAEPQRGSSSSGYPIESALYNDTGLYFKNYGDWPHLMQLVSADWNYPTKQDMKSWYGSKYGYFQEYIDSRRRDYPLEPWTAWWDNNTGPTTNPTIGMFAETDGIGWEVLSLAVNGIGNNSLLQQILPEGHQGDLFRVPNGVTMSYEYYVLTSDYGTNDTEVRDLCRRMNDQVIVEVGLEELFEHNTLMVHVADIDGITALGTDVNLYNATDLSLIGSLEVDADGNATFQQLPDGDYTVNVTFRTENLATLYVINSTNITFNHLVNRAEFLDINGHVANLSLNVVNWARSNEGITGLQIRIIETATSTTVDQNFTWNGNVDFRLYTDGTTDYYIEAWYGGLNRTMNITLPYTLTGNSNLDIGVRIDTTAITIISSDESVGFTDNFTMSFTFHKSSNQNEHYQVDNVLVSSSFDANFWTEGADFGFYWDPGTNITELNLTTGFTKKLNDSGVFEVYIHVINDSVEKTVEKIFVVVEDTPTEVWVLVDNINITDSLFTDIDYNQTFDVTVYYIDSISSSNITGTALVNLTLDGMSPWLLTPSGEGYTVSIDSSTLPLSNKYEFTVRCTNSSMQTQIFKFTIFTTDINTSLSVWVNGLNQADLNNQSTIRLGDQLNFTVRYMESATSNPISDATVIVRYRNVNTTFWENVTLTYVSNGNYTMTAANLTLSLDTFISELKDFKITATKIAYEARSESFFVDINRLDINPILDMPGALNNSITVDQREKVTVKIRLVNAANATFLNLTDVHVYLIGAALGGNFSEEMTAEMDGGSFTGYFIYDFNAPSKWGTYELTIYIDVRSIELIQQYDFVAGTFVLVVSQPQGSVIPEWVFYLLIGIIFGLVIYFISYQLRFKYPPLIRKIHDMKRAVRRGKYGEKIRNPKVHAREENIYGQYAREINVYRFLQTRDSRYAAKSTGYAPVPDGAVDLDFEMPSLEPEAIPADVGPKTGKKLIQEAALELKKPELVVAPPSPAKPISKPTPAVVQIKRPLPSAKIAPPKPTTPAIPSKPITTAKAAVKLPSLTPRGPSTPVTKVSTETVYQNLVALEQKRYKAERSLRELDGKLANGAISEQDHKQYYDKIKKSLDAVKEQITDLRRKLINF